jgi:hypothetical protein
METIMNYTKLVIGAAACLLAGATVATGYSQGLPGLFVYTGLLASYGLYMLARGARLV